MSGKTISKLIEEDIERESRVEMKPVPPSQLNRIERLLAWLVAYTANKGGWIEAMPYPDISDIIKSGN